MNPGITEDASKIATSVVDALRAQPMLLVLVIFNIFLLLLVYWSTVDQRNSFVNLIKLEHERTTHLMELVSNCIAGRAEK